MAIKPQRPDDAAPVLQRSNEDWLQALNGSGAAQADAYQALRQALYNAMLAYLGKQFVARRELHLLEARQIAEDCAQDALLAIRTNLARFRGESRFMTWAYAIGMRTVLADLRRRQWNKKRMAPEHLGQVSPDWPGSAAQAPSAERQVQREQAWLMLSQIIETELTERQRKALVAHAFQDMPLDAVALWLETNRDNVYKLIHDARKKLKLCLLARGISKNDLLRWFDGEQN
jgi:RNA polymerase sigma-70 factor (ECF subfamily)